MAIIKTGEKLVRCSVFLEKEDLEIYKEYAKISNKSLGDLIRSSMNVNVGSYSNKIKMNNVINKQV